MKGIPSGSVDMVLCDLPYGTTQIGWDTVIPFEPLWEQYRRACKPNAAIVLTAAQPFTSALVMSNRPAFKYEWIWRKNLGSGFAIARFQPMRYHESILVFCYGRATYSPIPTERFSEASKRQCRTPIRSGAGKSNHITGMRSGTYTQYDPELKSPESVLEYECVANGGGRKLHPTQKPVALFEYLIRTYTNPGEIVLDNCCGSGTTGLAAKNTGRNFIQFELSAEYCEIARKRVA